MAEYLILRIANNVIIANYGHQSMIMMMIMMIMIMIMIMVMINNSAGEVAGGGRVPNVTYR